MKKEDDAGKPEFSEEDEGWIFPKIFKYAFSKDKDLTLNDRISGVVGGTGMMVVEAIGRTYFWFKNK